MAYVEENAAKLKERSLIEGLSENVNNVELRLDPDRFGSQFQKQFATEMQLLLKVTVTHGGSHILHVRRCSVIVTIRRDRFRHIELHAIRPYHVGHVDQIFGSNRVTGRLRFHRGLGNKLELTSLKGDGSPSKQHHVSAKRDRSLAERGVGEHYKRRVLTIICDSNRLD